MIKNLRQTLGFLLVLSVTLLFSCDKETNKEPTTVDLIIRAPWKFSKATASGSDVSNLISACARDNILTFQSSATTKTGNVNEGATKCNAADAQSVDFTWEYDASFQKIKMAGTTGNVNILPGGSNEFTLVRVNETELVLSQNVTFLGTTQLVEVTLVH